jgi:TPR repeat protein
MFSPAPVRLCLPVVLLAAVVFLPPRGVKGQAVLAPVAEKGKKHALLIGVRNYASIKFETLKYTENDVEELARILSSRGGFTVRLLTTTRGEKNSADAPTADNVRAAIRALLARKTRDDLLLVALSGHGIQARLKDGDESFFCPSDAQLNDSDTLVSLTKLVKDLDACGAGIKLLLADACRNEPDAGRNVDVDTLPRLPSGTAALFSCKSGERAFETAKLGKGHGVFFYHVLQGLRGKARDARGAVTWTRLAEHVTDAVSEDVPRLIGGGARQTPEWKVNFTGKSPVLLPPLSISPEAEKLFQLAQEHDHGRGRKINKLEAARLYRQAAEKGHPFAEGLLGALYALGEGMKRDAEMAQKLYLGVLDRAREAARQGDSAAQYLLGQIHASGLGVEKDHAEALRWYHKAAAQDHARAQNNIGWMYRNGWGVAQDYAEALRWYRKAAEQNNASAQCNIGVMYNDGLGVTQDHAEALRWFRKAAEQENATAQYNLGVMHESGFGVSRDLEEARQLYRKAAAQDHADARRRLSRLE